MLARNKFGPALMLRETARVVKRVFQPTGICLAVLGSDGAGKSTLLAKMQTMLEPCFRHQKSLHFRPNVLQKRTHDDAAAITPIRTGESRKNALLTGWLRVGYYFADQWAGWLLIVLPARIRSTLVLFDRCFDDLLVDERRYRFSGTSPLVRVLRWFVPKPQLTFIPFSARAGAASAQARIAGGGIGAATASVARIGGRRKTLRARVGGATAGRSRARCLARSHQPPRRAGGKANLAPADATMPANPQIPWARLFEPEGPADASLVLRVLQKSGESFLLLPIAPALAARALALYPAQSTFARAAKWTLGASLRARLPLPLRVESAPISRNDPFPRFLMSLDGMENRELPALAILAGNPHTEGRRFILLLFGEDGLPAFVVKAGMGETAKRLIQHESAFLQSACQRTFPACRSFTRSALVTEQVEALALDFVAIRN